MNSSLHLLPQITYAFIILLFAQACLRIISNTFRKHITLSDITWSVMLSLLAQLPTLPILISGLLLLQWLNALMMRHYGIKLNLHSVKIFLSGPGQFNAEAADSWKLLKQDVRTLLFPLFFLPMLIHVNAYGLSLSLVYTAATLSKSKFKKNTVGYWLAISALALASTHFIKSTPVPFSLLLTLPLIAFIAQIILPKKNRFCGASMLALQLRDEHLKLEQIPLKAAHTALNATKSPPIKPSGLTKNANIILVTLESIHSQYLNTYNPTGIETPYFNSLKGIRSARHYTPCAFTNAAINNIYQGNPLQHLGNYQRFFVTSQKTADFNLDQLLATLSFDHIIDNTTITKRKHQTLPDPSFFPQAGDEIKKHINANQPVFIHLMNNQTHGPYFTYQTQHADRKTRYLHAIQEADTLLKHSIQQLGNSIDLNNTLIVYTADHGESFMEEGYNSHSNAIIREQLEVPFVISHPALTEETLPHSTHADIFPTLFDLLGKQALGQSLLKPLQPLNLLLYSETKTGNTPSSFGWLNNQQKIYLDRYQQKFEIRDLDDNTLTVLDESEKHYWLNILAKRIKY